MVGSALFALSLHRLHSSCLFLASWEAWTAILSALVLDPTYTGNGDAIVPLGVLALGLLLYTRFSPGLGRRTREAGIVGSPASLVAS